jgi:hypothetical protein
MDILQRRMPATFSLPHALLVRLNSEVTEGRRSRWVEEVLTEKLEAVTGRTCKN